MPALSPNLDLRRSLDTVREIGAASVPRILTEPFRQQLRREIEAGPFERLPDQMGPVRTETELFIVRDADMPSFPVIGELREAFVGLLRDHGSGIQGLEQWWPNEVYVQRYHPQTLGVSPHLDSKGFVYLVAVFTVEGSAPFALCKDRDGDVLQEWQTSPGSLVLLRGPGLENATNGRPFHTVKGPSEGTRLSVTFRMNSRASSSRASPSL